MGMVQRDLAVSVIIPLFNEEDNISTLVSRIANSLEGCNFEIVLVDDGSLDKTSDKIDNEIKKNDIQIIKVSHASNLGISEAWWSGVNSSNGDLICLIDGDLQNPPEYIKDMYQILIQNQVEVVQAYRSSLGRQYNSRYMISRSLNSVLNFVFSQNAKDSKSGFLLGYKETLLEVLRPLSGLNYQQNFIGVGLRDANCSILELETLFAERMAGESFLAGIKSINASIKALIDIPKYYFKYRNRFRNNLFPEIVPAKSPSYRGLRRLIFEFYFWTFPLHTWVISRRTRKYYLYLKTTEFYTKNQIQNLQLTKLQQLIKHAYRTVPYYRDLLQSKNIRPESIQTLEDLSLLPLLEKKDVRNNIHFRMFSTTHKKSKLHKINTSGSTGEPFICYADQDQLEIRFATTLRAYEMAGWKFGDKQTRLWHQKLGMNSRMVVKEKLDAILMRRRFVPAYEMTKSSISELFNSLNARKPLILDGYAESFNFLAQSESSLTYTPTAVISSAQQLTQETRNTIEAKFGCRVIDKYGSREFSGIAYECKEGKYHHVQDESYIVEILVDNRKALPGEVGEIVITDLNNLSVPLIRYRIGDLAEAVDQDTCRCGRSQQMIGNIVGRSQALINCSNGVWLPGTFFAHFFKDYQHLVKHYQIYQDTHGSFDLKLVVTQMFNENSKMKILGDLSQFTGETEINIEIVDAIPLLATGKRTPVISKLKYDFQNLKSQDIKSR